MRSGQEKGAAFAVYYKGNLVVDLWGGYADYGALRYRKAESTSLAYSATKAVAAVCLGYLFDRCVSLFAHSVCLFILMVCVCLCSWCVSVYAHSVCNFMVVRQFLSLSSFYLSNILFIKLGEGSGRGQLS